MSNYSLPIALVYGTDTGNTEEVGGKIASALRQHGYSVDMMNVTDVASDVLVIYLHKYLLCVHRHVHKFLLKTYAQVTLFVLEKAAQII